MRQLRDSRIGYRPSKQEAGIVLVLNRRLGQAIVMDGGIRVIVLQCDRGRVRLGIEAPGATNVFREELVLESAPASSAGGGR
jgi:carbon storage regulator